MRAADFAELQAFLAIAQERSFRRAAGRLNLTPSTLSHSLRALEARLGVQLIARTTRAVAVTPAGTALLEALTPALRDVEAAVEGVNAFRPRPHGTVRLTLPRSAATMILAPRLCAFAHAYPDGTLEAVVDDRFVDIVREGFDAGIRLGESVEKDMVAVRLTADLRAAVVASPAYFARHPPPAHPQELQHHRLINRRLLNTGGLYRWAFAKDGQALDVLGRGPLVSNADGLMLRAALDGLGVAMLGEAEVIGDLAEGRLVRVLQDWCPPISGFHLYHPANRQGSASLSALIETLTSPVAVEADLAEKFRLAPHKPSLEPEQ